MGEVISKPSVTVAQCRLLSLLWPHAAQCAGNFDRNQLISDIFDGRITRDEARPLIAGGFAVEVCHDDPKDIPERFWTWQLTPLGERAVFGHAAPTDKAAGQ